MMRRISLLLLALPLAATAKDWNVDAAHSTLGFTGSYQGETFQGRFGQFEAKIAYDSADLGQAHFDVQVKLGSVDTRSSERDQTLTGSDFFAVDRFPTAHFVTRDFRKGADGNVVADGTLTLHGISKPVTLKVDFKPDGTAAVLDVSTTLNRLDYKLGASDDWADISTQIPVHAHLLLH